MQQTKELTSRVRGPRGLMRLRPFMRTSASQISNFELCRRKWWFKSVLGLPEMKQSGAAFGTVFHGVVERYLKADDAGYLDGKPVNLYPPGWDRIYRQTWVGGKRVDTEDIEAIMTAREQLMIRELIDIGIETGVLARKPRRLIEHGVTLPVTDSVQLIGAIDVFVPNDYIEDHKTTKKWRYAKSSKALAEDRQVLIYAKAAIEKARQERGAIPDQIFVRHNQYCREPENAIRVRKVEATVTRAAVESNWRQVVEITEDMRKTALVVSPSDVPDPEPNACRAFGGCPFINICGKTESVEAYVTRVDRLNGDVRERLAAEQQKPSASEEQDDMGLNFTKLTQKAPPAATGNPQVNPPAVAAAPPPPATPAPAALPAAVPAAKGSGLFAKRMAAAPPAAAPVTDPTPTVVTTAKAFAAAAPPEIAAAVAAATVEPAPWYLPGCTACAGNQVPGFNSLGRPCKVCDAGSKKSGKQTSADFVVGKFCWDAREEAQAASAPSPAPVAEAATEAPPAAAEPVEQEPQEGTLGAPARRGPGRRRKTFTLLIGCVPERAGTKVIDLAEIFPDVQKKICENVGAENFWDLDPFRRRDALNFIAEGYAEEFGTSVVVANYSGGSVDQKVFVDALRPFASTVFRGTVG